jgi:5-methylcytosine-specific restriction endonuclease McrBC regulatory subunit McrC
MTYTEYEALLINQDWTYQMSEDKWAYRRGLQSMLLINKHKNDSPRNAQLYIKHYKKVEI